ncbi:polyphosphate kinase 2 [Agrobacterium sp. rho-13.3]|jgi:polyphosphate kinase 2|uniref:polyphosphate kinase 2 n=1 Tax=Agrobacterium sp. rho-13.3 TaxID=3072980 RepID=UPI002A0C5D19|nr:polyphosphate kinase 2 [Agrobacterium sp. rho-13.3]MDX8310841.1 polyphosphate kinase 2 [Agrobacterium sp. rho-13.3]
MSENAKDRSVELQIDGKTRIFNIDDPVLPDWVEDKKLSAGGFPYDKKMNRDDYDKTLEALQVELVKVQFWLQATGKRVMSVFEGRDAAGKGGAISVVTQYLNPRAARVVALTKPTETERGQWYFQRYISHFPTAGEFVLFDRSWYNRAGVEPVMGFCTPEEHKRFLKETPRLEKMVVHEGTYLFKFWLDTGRETQIDRFHDRRHSLLKSWKLSDMDIAALTKWDDYTAMRDLMLEKTHIDDAPWTVVRANDKRRARINLIKHILKSLDYDGKDKKVIGDVDDKILGFGPDFLK